VTRKHILWVGVGLLALLGLERLARAGTRPATGGGIGTSPADDDPWTDADDNGTPGSGIGICVEGEDGTVACGGDPVETWPEPWGRDL